MGILSSFFDVVAGVSILAGRSSLLDTTLTQIAGRNFTVRGALGLSFLSVGFINLWATSRKQKKIERLTKDAETFNAELEEEEFGEYFFDDEGADLNILTYALTGGNEFFLKGEEGGDYVEIFINDESVGETYVWWDKDMEQEVGGDCRYIVINNEMFHLRDMFDRDEVSAETFNAEREVYVLTFSDPMRNGKLVELPFLTYEEAQEYIEANIAPYNANKPFSQQIATRIIFPSEEYNAPAAVMRTYKGRKSPSVSAKSVKVGTRKRGNDGKMWQVRSVKSRGKRTQRWFKD